MQPVENCYHATRTIFPVDAPCFNGSVEDFPGHIEDEFYTAEPTISEPELLDKTGSYRSSQHGSAHE